MLVDGIKSRPRYSELTVNRFSRNHIFIADGVGANAIMDLFINHEQDIKGRITIIFCRNGDASSELVARLFRLRVDFVHVMPTLATAVGRLASILDSARMGTQIYAAGSETLNGLTVQLLQAYGMDPQSVIAEHRGTLARRVQCVHCKGFTEKVCTNVVKCAHCSTHLLVRDHYSVRRAAFQGVSVDAEVPGDIPTIVEVFK